MTDAISTFGEGFVVVKEADGPPSEKLTPGEWVKRKLFPGPMNTIITLVIIPIGLFGLYRLLRFIFVTGQWDPVSVNLELFMVGLFPREERWRIVAQAMLMGLGLGLVVGTLRGRGRDVAEDTGEEPVKQGWRPYVRSYWSIALLLAVVLLGLSRTVGPWLVAGGTIGLAFVGWLVAAKLPRGLRPLSWTLTAMAIVASFQVLTGTAGFAWFFGTITLVPVISSIGPRLTPAMAEKISPVLAGLGVLVALYAAVTQSTGWAIIFGLVALYGVVQYLQGDRIDSSFLGMMMVAGLIVSLLYGTFDPGGVDWSDWGGMQLNLVATVLAIGLAFPFGMLLALGRRSSLPVVRLLSVVYIEFFRGAPLITFLLAGQFFLGFFINTDSPLSLVTRAIAAMTLFSAAYVAEIIRGGLQAVPQGQVEAGMASGLSQAKITRLIVMPQALRAVIPAMVGQFISLFKDTSLLSILSISELLDVRSLVHAQEAFRGRAIAETITFVAFGFWAFAYAMSQESQRLERRLGVGIR